MKTIVLAIALCCIAMAQNVAKIGGTPHYPTIENVGNQPILGYVAVRHTDNGIDSSPLLILDTAWVTDNRMLQPGEKRMLLGNAGGGGVRFEAVDASGNAIHEGEPISYELTGVLLADGTFHGTDNAFYIMAMHYNKVRSIARDLQVIPDKYTAMARPRPKAAIGASMDFDQEMSRLVLSNDMLGIKARRGEPEAENALARLAALPDMVKGE